MFTPMSGLPDVPRVSPRRLEDARAELNQLAPSQSLSYNPLTGFPEIPSASPRALDDTALVPKKSFLQRAYEFFVPKPLTAKDVLPPLRAETIPPPSQNKSELNLMPSS